MVALEQPHGLEDVDPPVRPRRCPRPACRLAVEPAPGDLFGADHAVAPDPAENLWVAGGENVMRGRGAAGAFRPSLGAWAARRCGTRRGGRPCSVHGIGLWGDPAHISTGRLFRGRRTRAAFVSYDSIH